MALTTETSRKAVENPVTDVNANSPAPTAPPRRMLSPEAQILFDKSIVARPLLTPEVCSIRPKVEGFYFRFVNISSNRGQIYMQRKAMGFVNATKEDVDIVVGNAESNSDEIRAGDLILMKMPYHLWAAHVKSNMLKAQVLGNARGVYLDGEASQDVWNNQEPSRKTVNSEPFSRGTSVPFIPTDIDKVIDQSIASGRSAKTRETVQALRDRGAQEAR